MSNAPVHYGPEKDKLDELSLEMNSIILAEMVSGFSNTDLSQRWTIHPSGPVASKIVAEMKRRNIKYWKTSRDTMVLEFRRKGTRLTAQYTNKLSWMLQEQAG